MARKRMISPTIWEDPTFNSKSYKCRLSFIGMFSNADDDGYLRGDYKSLRRLVFGFDDDNDKEWYEELKGFKSLHFFEERDEIFSHFLKWEEYQTQREDRKQASIYPRCVICQTSDGQVTAEVSKLSKVSKEVSKGYKKFQEAKKQIGKI